MQQVLSIKPIYAHGLNRQLLLKEPSIKDTPLYADNSLTLLQITKVQQSFQPDFLTVEISIEEKFRQGTFHTCPLKPLN